MFQCPIHYFMDNLIFNADGSCHAAFKLTGYDYDFLDDESKIAILHKTARFMSGIMTDAQILIVPVEQNNKEHFRKLSKKIRKTDPLYDAAINHARDTEKYLQENIASSGDVNDYRFYVIVKLVEHTESELVAQLKDLYDYIVKNPMNAIHVILNLDTKDILMSRIQKYHKLSEKWFFSANKKISMQIVDGEEVQWLLRRSAFRGLNEPVNLFYRDMNYSQWVPKSESVSIGTEEIIKPYGRDILNLFSGAITTKGRVLMIEHDNKVSFQTFLVITNLPDVIEYPGCEWLYMLQQYNSQAEICIHIKAVEYRESLRKIELKKREINSQIDNVTEVGADIPDTLGEGKEYADALETEVRGYKDPILNTTITICLAADSLESLEAKVSTIKEAYEDMNFVVERPIADQLKLYMAFIPSVGNLVKDYVMRLTPMSLAGGVIGAVHELGDKNGPYIGTTGIEQKQVFLELGIACLRNKSASATFYGNLGVGKSFNANLLLALIVLYGGYGLIFDPKGERSHWESDFKLFRGLITTVTLSGDEKFKGKLDPYNIYRDNINLANELAFNMISELLKISPTSKEYTAMLEAARIMKANYENGICVPSMQQFVKTLQSFDEKDDLCKVAKMLGRNLSLQKENGMAILLFGDGSEDAITIDNRLNIIQIQNLKLPSPEAKKEDYTSEEMLSTVVMMVLSHFAKRFALVKRPVFKVILFDESWALSKTTEGVKLIDFLTRMGRSLYTGIILNGHSVLDLPTEGIKNTISYKFCFQTLNDAEAGRMCDYLGLESTVDNKSIIKGLQNAECLFKDLDGHVGILKFDAVFQDIIDVFSTTPETDEINETNETNETDDTNDTSSEKETSLDAELIEIKKKQFEEMLFEKEVI